MSAIRLASKIPLNIPKYIERGPTDILKALASTVKNVPGEPDSLMQDDPYLLPRRPSDRRLYLLSKLSGAKTAKFILNKHPELFLKDDSEPKVESFQPMEEFRNDMEFTIDDLKWCIKNDDIENGIIAFNWFKENDVKLDDETLLEFFELLCYTNEERLLDSIDIERSQLTNNSDDQLVKYTWKRTGLASKIFNEIKEDLEPPRVYSAMIAGLSKFNEHSTAKQVFDDFKEAHKDTGLYPTAYNALLKSVNRLSSSVITANEAIQEIVDHMEANLVMPNLEIFNSILSIIREYKTDDDSCQKAFKLLNDMKALKIEPSLATYAPVIQMLCRYKGGQVYGDYVNEIINYIDSSMDVFNLRDERDVQFLNMSMNVIANVLNNLQLAKNLHKIYLKNPNLFASNRFKNRYLNTYFKLIVTTETLDDILDFYNSYVPMNFQPSVDTYEAMIEALDLYQADESVVKKIGKDLIQNKFAKLIKNDAIFKKDPDYVEALEKLNFR